MMDKYILAQKWLDEMKERELVKFVRPGEEPPMGYVKIDDPIATSYGPKFGAVGLPEEAKEAGVVPQDVRVFGRRIMGEYYAPADIGLHFKGAAPGMHNDSASLFGRDRDGHIADAVMIDLNSGARLGEPIRRILG